MCGLIAGFTASAVPEVSIARALDRMQRRGPDDQGIWIEEGASLGHRRLSVLDLDSRASQPMHSTCGRYVIVFNGEIYNFRELRKRLESAGTTFHTSSDTEVLLAMFASEGEGMLAKLRGMFAFVIWDRVAKRAFAARDPYGIKPLYYAATQEGIIFASQVKALLATGMVSRESDLLGQAGFWMLGTVPDPHTWYRDICALRSGHCAWIEQGRITRLKAYWDIGDTWRTAETNAPVSDGDVRERVQTALQASVAHHLVADVPVGIFLSGGIDSGALTGLMVEAGARDLQGITIAYDEFASSHKDESPVAAAIAVHYGITHHVRRVTREEFLADLPRILNAMDQPSIDGVNTWYASKAVAELGLKVVVSGVGGDELFQGYSGFTQLPALVARWRAASRIPGAKGVARVLADLKARRTGNARWRHAPEWAQTMAGAWWLQRSVRAPEELASLMGTSNAAEVLQRFSAAARVEAMTGTVADNSRLAVGQIESMTYMRNQLLRDSDWASMDHSVELRTPLVDAHLLRQVAPLLSSFAHFPNKALLAEAPTKALPRAIIDRRKTGFGIPMNRWLQEDGNGATSNWQMRVAEAYGAKA